MLYLTDGQPSFCPKCGKPIDPQLRGWEAQDRFYNGNHPFLCNCGARYLIGEECVNKVFDSADSWGCWYRSTGESQPDARAIRDIGSP